MTSVALPEAFCAQMIDLLGSDEAQELFTALEQPSPVSIRLNRRKHTPQMLEAGQPIAWSPLGRYLTERPSFVGDPLWHSGAYYVQEASSMILSLIAPLMPQRSLNALDLCAAPGGKSTLLLDLLPEASLLVSNEVVRTRAHILQENLLKWGHPSTIVTHVMPEALGRLTSAFDLILVDAPCSGEGMFRKDHEARSEWSPEAVLHCASRQRSILNDIWPSLAPGGLMIYSTCTMNLEENERMLHYITSTLGGEALSLPQLPEGIEPSPYSQEPCYRMMPHRVSGEGLFMAIIRKGEGGKVSDGLSNTKRRRPGGKVSAKGGREGLALTTMSAIHSWLQRGADRHWGQSREGELFALEEAHRPMLERLEAEGIHPLTSGIPVAILKGRDLIPHPALAHSTELAPKAFEEVELTRLGAIRYLAGEAITLPLDLPVGWYIVCYEGNRLGFVKHLGRRSNNHYPAPWRIRQPQPLYQRLGAMPDILEP